MLLQSKVLFFFAIFFSLIIFEWFFFSEYRSRILKEEMNERGSLLVRTFAQLSREPLLALQITRLEHQLDSLLDERDVLSAQIYTTDYKILAATDRQKEGWSLSGEIVPKTELYFEKDVMIARSPIIILDKNWGMAEIIFSLHNMNVKINQSKKIFVMIFIAEFVLAVCFAFFLQIQVVKPLGRLAYEVKKISPAPLKDSLSHLPFTASEITRVISSINDMRSKLKIAQEELISKTQLATMGQIAANITHEIRNPLEAISGAVEIISSEGNLNRNSMESLLIIKDEIQNLNDYLSTFLEFVRSEPVYLENVQINKLLKDCFFLLKPIFLKKGINIKFKLDKNLPSLGVDINQIKRVIVNILLNAIEAISKNPKLWITTAEKENIVIINIRDNGRGIDSEYLPHVFELYFTTKKNGSGIGLALSKKIIEQHGGSILIDSSLGTGTTVTIQLPLNKKDKCNV